MNHAKKYFQVLRDNEDLTFPGLQTLKRIEEEFDKLCLHEHINKLTCKECKKFNDKINTHEHRDK